MGDFSRAWKRELNRAERDAGRDLGRFARGIGAQLTKDFSAQGEYNIRNARAYQREAGRQGNRSGRDEAYFAYGGPQNDFNRGARSAVRSGARQAGRGYGRQALNDALNGGYNAGATNEAARLDIVQFTDARVFKDKEYILDNQGAQLSDAQHAKIKAGLEDIFKGNSGKSLGMTTEAGVFATLLQNGVHPDAVIHTGNGNSLTLDQVIDKAVGGGKAGKAEAHAVLSEYRTNFNNAVALGQTAQQFTSAANGLAQPPQSVAEIMNAAKPEFSGVATYNASASVADKLGQLVTVNSLSDDKGKLLSSADRLKEIEQVMGGITTQQDAQAFHKFLQDTPKYAANMAALVSSSGLADQELANAATKVSQETARIGALDVAGRDAAAGKLANNAQNQSAQQQAQQQRKSGLSTDELTQIKINDDALQARLDKAISQNQEWDRLAKDNPIVGMMMTLFRPLLQAMSPDSNPNTILAEAAKNGVEIQAGEQAIVDKLGERYAGATVVLNTNLSTEAQARLAAENAKEDETNKGADAAKTAGPTEEQLQSLGKSAVNVLKKVIIEKTDLEETSLSKGEALSDKDKAIIKTTLESNLKDNLSVAEGMLDILDNGLMSKEARQEITEVIGADVLAKAREIRETADKNQVTSVDSQKQKPVDMGIGANGVPNSLNKDAPALPVKPENPELAAVFAKSGINLGNMGVTGDGASIKQDNLGDLNQVASNQAAQKNAQGQGI